MSAWAKPGVKCVCVDSAPMPYTHRCGMLPAPGTVVTITGVRQDFAGRGIHLVISGSPNVVYGVDVGWRIGRFRPLITKTQEEDVALFRPLLTDLPVKELI